MADDDAAFAMMPSPEDYLQILATFSRYTEALDGGHAEAWVACFTPDVHYCVRDRGAAEPLHEAVGSEALLSYRLRHPVVRPGVAWQHVVSNVRISVDASGRRARARSYWTSIQADPEPVILGFGAYDDLLERQADGTWLIASRVTEAHAARGSGPRRPPAKERH